MRIFYYRFFKRSYLELIIIAQDMNILKLANPSNLKYIQRLFEEKPRQI